MSRGAQQLGITVVPDSGTGDLAGMKRGIQIKLEAAGKPICDLEYPLTKTD